MGKILRVKPFVLLIVAWLAGLARLHAWAQEEDAAPHVVALSLPVTHEGQHPRGEDDPQPSVPRDR